MFIVPKYIMQGFGMLLGYFYNILLIGVFVVGGISSWNDGEILMSLGFFAFALLLSLWTFTLVKKKIKANK